MRFLTVLTLPELTALHTKQKPATGYTKVRRSILSLPILLALALFAGCDSKSGLAGLERDFTVMTRNLYLGANLFDLLDPACADDAILGCVAQLYATVAASDPHGRMGAIAAEIEANDPDLVGLQEVSMYFTQFPGNNHIPGSETQATTLQFDFLQILLDSLVERGMRYNVVATNTNADVEFPSTTSGITFTDVRLVDRDVILAKRDIDISNVSENNFDAAITTVIEIGGQDIEFTRGFSHVLAEKFRVSFTFANAHLELGGDAVQAQLAQGAVLKSALSTLQSPIIVVGDFNSDPTDPGNDGSVYRDFTDNYSDAWAAAQNTSGFTCCQDDLLRSTPSQLDRRIDFILLRGLAEATSAEVIGNDEADMTPGGVWPSDHAGVVSTITVRN